MNLRGTNYWVSKYYEKIGAGDEPNLSKRQRKKTEKTIIKRKKNLKWKSKAHIADYSICMGLGFRNRNRL